MAKGCSAPHFAWHPGRNSPDETTIPLACGGRAPYFNSMSEIHLSPAAAARVAAIAKRQGQPARLRVSVDGGGCAGFQYKFELAGEAAPDDLEVQTDGVGLLIDSISLPFLAGSTVDYVENLGGAAFQVNNPQAASSCGCGTSFSV